MTTKSISNHSCGYCYKSFPNPDMDIIIKHLMSCPSYDEEKELNMAMNFWKEKEVKEENKRQTIVQQEKTEELELYYDENKFYCNLCSKSYTKQSSLKRHIRCHTHKIYTCNFCKKTFKYKGSLGKHKKQKLHFTGEEFEKWCNKKLGI